MSRRDGSSQSSHSSKAHRSLERAKATYLKKSAYGQKSKNEMMILADQ